MSSIFEQALEYVGYKEPVTEGLFISRERKEHQEQLENQFRSKLERVWPKFKKEVIEKSVNEVKSKTKHKLPWDIEYNECDYHCEKCIDIKVFKDEWCMNEYDNNYDPEAVKAFDAIFYKIQAKLDMSKYFSKDEISSMRISSGVDVAENNFISVSIQALPPY